MAVRGSLKSGHAFIESPFVPLSAAADEGALRKRASPFAQFQYAYAPLDEGEAFRLRQKN